MQRGNMLINGQKIDLDEPTYIIAEAGANHNRNFDMVKRFIDVVTSAKTDAAKFQTHSTDTLYLMRC